MHHFIFPTQDTWISSGSNKIDGTPETDQNFGRDEILEVKKFFHNNSFDYPTRALVSFAGDSFNKLTESINNGDIPAPTAVGAVSSATNSQYFLKLYEAEGNSELVSGNYTLAVQPISSSWVEGIGKFGDKPKVTDGCSWDNRSNPNSGVARAWTTTGGDVHSVSSSEQTFSNQSPDVNVEVTNMFRMWKNAQEENHGMLIRFSGSQETNSITTGNLKFFSKDTSTIYSPKLEVRWNDATFDNSVTSSLNELTMSGLADNYLYMRGLKDSYKENDRVKFRVGARKRYIQKTFSESVQNLTGSYVTKGSGSYAIKDIATDEFIIPFSAYTSMSYDSEGSYFNQWLDGFYPDRVYKILLKLKYDDGQEQIFDDNFEFKVKR